MNMSHNNNQTAAIALQNLESQATSLQKEQRIDLFLGGVILTISIIGCYLILGGDTSLIDASFSATSKASLLR